jgi:hypothetical protein
MPAKKAVEPKGVRSQTWTDQEDVDITENLAHPRMQTKDYVLLMFSGWLAVVVGAVCGQWVVDEMLGHLFFWALWVICFGLWRAIGAEFLWSIFLKRDLRATMKKAGLVGGILVGSALLFWGSGVLVYTYCDLWQTGLYSLMFPVVQDATWKEVLYLIGVFFFMYLEGIFQTVYWNVLYDNCMDRDCKANVRWMMRFWGAFCMGCAVFCYNDPAWKGRWWWTFPTIMAVFKGLMTLVSFVLYDKMSFGAALALRLGIYTATYTLWMGVYFQWWGQSWTLLQFINAPGNLIDTP